LKQDDPSLLRFKLKHEKYMASSKQGLKIIIFIELQVVDFVLLSTGF